jgi:MoxR-like ATPase
MGEDRRTLLKTLSAIMRPEELVTAQAAVRKIHASPSLIDYLQKIAQNTREAGIFAEGMSPRAAIALLQAARAWSALEGRDHVLPEDIQAVLVPVIAHRLRPLKAVSSKANASADLLTQLMLKIAV